VDRSDSLRLVEFVERSSHYFLLHFFCFLHHLLLVLHRYAVAVSVLVHHELTLLLLLPSLLGFDLLVIYLLLTEHPLRLVMGVLFLLCCSQAHFSSELFLRIGVNNRGLFPGLVNSCMVAIIKIIVVKSSLPVGLLPLRLLISLLALARLLAHILSSPGIPSQSLGSVH